MARDCRDERIAEPEAAFTASEARNAARDARIAEIEQLFDELSEPLTELLEKLGQNFSELTPAAVERSAGCSGSAPR